MLAVAGLGAVAILVSKLVRRFVPEIVVFLALGLLVGPEGPLGLINEGNIASLKLVTTVALGMIIFLLGDRLRMVALREHLRVLLPITLLQVAVAAGLVFLATVAAGASVRLAFVLGLIAAETGVLTVTATVREEGARGAFTERLLTSVGLTNVVVAALFGLTFPFVLATSPDVSGPTAVVVAFAQILVASTVIGLAGAWLLARFGAGIETSGELLLLIIVVITGISGVVLAVGGSVVVATLVAGVYVANRTPWLADRLFAAVRTLEAPIYLVFFIVAGAGIHLDELATVGLMGALYVVFRTVGKIGGSLLGSRVTSTSFGEGFHLGVGMLPHAGMAIALVAFVVEQAPRLAEDVSGVVLGSIVLFELAGPMVLRRSLRQTGDAGRAGNGEEDPVADPAAPPRFRRIAVAVGSSEVAVARLPLLLRFIAQMEAEVVVVHVSRPGGGATSSEEPEVLQSVQRMAAGLSIRCTTRHVVSERVSSAIANTVREEEVDLLLMGQPLHVSLMGATGWSKTTQRVAALVDVPMLVYPVDPNHPTATVYSDKLAT